VAINIKQTNKNEQI